MSAPAYGMLGGLAAGYDHEKSAARLRSLRWFARHEMTLAWRDWVQLMSGGRRLTDRAVFIGMALFAVGLHAVAYALLAPQFAVADRLGLPTLVVLTAALALVFTMMLSQAMEQVTRAFYARDDLDLILSSPAPSQDLFAVRIALMALTTAAMSGLMVAPFVNVAAWLGGPSWLAGYIIVMAVSALATGAAVLITLALFRWVGAKRTRLVSQIAAAVVGASFLIGLQVVAIIAYGSMSRWTLLTSGDLIAAAPGLESWLWLPARAVTGEPLPLMAVTLASIAFFVFATLRGADSFRDIVVRALAVPEHSGTEKAASRSAFRQVTPRQALMRKELMLLARDPWLLSQTLMQILYLLPPALMLWVNFGHETSIAAIIAPVIVMAVGQLAGGLAWLTLSGEDAPDLVASAPVSASLRVMAKVQAVLMIVSALILPLVAALALVSLWGAGVTLASALLAAASAILIQFWFRAQAKRSNFRRRQVASKASTFAEAFASISCAGFAGLAAAGHPGAVVALVFVGIVLGIAAAIRPRQA